MKKLIDKKSMILVILVLLCIVAIVLQLHAQKGATVIVERDGQKLQEYSLAKDQTVKLSDEHGYNTLCILGGEATVIEADCPGKDCTRFAPISRSGQSIICLPHKLNIYIVED